MGIHESRGAHESTEAPQLACLMSTEALKSRGMHASSSGVHESSSGAHDSILAREPRGALWTCSGLVAPLTGGGRGARELSSLHESSGAGAQQGKGGAQDAPDAQRAQGGAQEPVEAQSEQGGAQGLSALVETLEFWLSEAVSVQMHWLCLGFR